MTSVRRRLTKALDLIDAEIEQLEAEVEAFSRFGDTVAEMSIPSPVPESPRMQFHGRTDKMEEIRASYRETVMDTPNYGTEYGETLFENVSMEFSPELATALNMERPPPEFDDHLVRMVTKAKEGRERFIDELHEEREDVRAVSNELTDLDDRLRQLSKCSTTRVSIASLIETWVELDHLEDRCENISRQRQQTIHDRRCRFASRPYDLTEFLYADLDTTYPVLSSVARLLTRVDERKNGYSFNEAT